jgi:hypothetical protein
MELNWVGIGISDFGLCVMRYALCVMRYTLCDMRILRILRISDVNVVGFAVL